MHSVKPPFPVYGMDVSNEKETPFRLAVSSFIRKSENKVLFLKEKEKEKEKTRDK